MVTPDAKARHVREFLLHLYNFEVSEPRIHDCVNAAFHLVSASDRAKIVAGLNARARADGFAPTAYWHQLLDFWLFDPAIVADDAALSIKLHQFHRLLTPQNAAAPIHDDAAAPLPRKREFRSRSRKALAQLKARPIAGVHLKHRHIERVLEPASFLAQHHGRLCNASADIFVKAPPEVLDTAASAAITRFTHELGLRIQDWAGEKGDRSYHWIYRNHRSGDGIRCLLALHVPYEHMAAAEHWLRGKVWKIDAAEQVTVAANWWNPQPRNTRARDTSRLQFHWKRLRELCEALSPDVEHWDADGTRKPLRQLLGLKPRAVASEPMTIKMVGSSRSLDRSSRKAAEKNKMGLISAFRDAAWHQIDSGWELLEYRDRLAETAAREDQIRRVEYIGSEESPLAQKRYAEEREVLFRQWPDNPRDRPRTWMPWWSEDFYLRHKLRRPQPEGEP
jgi:hypothetical protein